MSWSEIYSIIFGLIGILFGIFSILQLKKRISIVSNIATLTGWFAYHILFILLVPIPSPFVDYLVVEWMFIPEILLIMTFREKIVPIFVAYSIVLTVLGVALPWFSIFGSAMIMFVPVGSAMLAVYKHPLLGIAYALASLGILYLNLMLSGAINIIGALLGFSIFWIIFGVGIGLLFFATKNKPPPKDFTPRHGIAVEFERKSIHISLLAFYIPLFLGEAIARLIFAAYLGALGGYPELEYLLSQGGDVVGVLLTRYAFAMLMFPFFFVDFLRLRFPDRYTPAGGYATRVMRRKENSRFLGSTDILIGGAIGLLFMNRTEILITIVVIVAADTASAIVGTSIGKHKIYQGKTAEGTIAGVVCGTIFAWAVSGNVLLSLIAGLTFIGADILSDIIPASDNLIAPVALALVFWYL